MTFMHSNDQRSRPFPRLDLARHCAAGGLLGIAIAGIVGAHLEINRELSSIAGLILGGVITFFVLNKGLR